MTARRLPTKDQVPVLPDWSFQDDAYQATLQSLLGDPNRKVGLIIPTGGGKTRIGVRILLRLLAESSRSDGVVLWVTHRKFLIKQARRELQRAINEGTPDLPDDAIRLLTERVHITMVGDLTRHLDEYGERVVLIVVDEAHHAAASSYAPIFEHKPLRGLFLTATPNRTDSRAIGIDEVAYTITYRQLFERGVLIEPSFEKPLVVPDPTWRNSGSLEVVADYVAERAQLEFVKTIVIASQVKHVEAMHDAIARVVENYEQGHVLGPADIGFVHGDGSSTGAAAEDFLDEFAALPRGVLVTTAQMLGEGFDEPNVNAVVVTYPTTSMIQLMQAAGRCLRYAPGKKEAFVVQVKESTLAYHFEQRWLYQEISDELRPQLIDHTYKSRADLENHLEDILDTHRVVPAVRASIRERLAHFEEGEVFSVMLTGLPYSGDPSNFSENADWSGVAVTPKNRDLFLDVFNDFSNRVGEVRFAGEFLRDYVEVDSRPGSEWSVLRDMLTAMEYARHEISHEAYWGNDCRNYQENRGTTWLTYVTFRFAPAVPTGLREFLADVLNREELLTEYAAQPAHWETCVKIALPLEGSLGFLFDAAQLTWFERERIRVVPLLKSARPLEAFAILEAWRVMLRGCPLPMQVVARFERFLSAESFSTKVHNLGSRHHGDPTN